MKAEHVADYQNLFNRVAVNLNSRPSVLPTSRLLEEYKQGRRDTWLEELMFQYGRHLLISSSREKSLPANLQGTWSQYESTPWTGGYWHNINVQMNYWGAMSANLAETFEAYIAYFNAYLPQARKYATGAVKKGKPGVAVEGDDNGWILGTAANAYSISGPGGHSGPGTGGFTSKLLMDYALFTGDREFLENVAYPAMLSMNRFYSITLVPKGDLLLVEPSASPENQAKAEQIKDMPGKITKGGHYMTVGCTFDQGFVWENFNDTLVLAKFLGRQDPFLKTIEEQMAKLDPILIGTSGQIKEYREENAYSDIGDPCFGLPVAAKCVVFTAGHRYGWANWNSDLRPWNAMDKGPKRDLIGELAAAVRKRGLKYAPFRRACARWDFQPFAWALVVCAIARCQNWRVMCRGSLSAAASQTRRVTNLTVNRKCDQPSGLLPSPDG